jgi:hypothetical protein
MPKIQDTTTKMPGKYGNKSSFSRDKKYANSSADIEYNAENVNKYKEMREQERRHNLEVANGQDSKNRPTEDSKSRPTEDSKNRPTEDSKNRPTEDLKSRTKDSKNRTEDSKNQPQTFISCECGNRGLFAWFSPEGNKLILCDECYMDRD